MYSFDDEIFLVRNKHLHWRSHTFHQCGQGLNSQLATCFTLKHAVSDLVPWFADSPISYYKRNLTLSTTADIKTLTHSTEPPNRYTSSATEWTLKARESAKWIWLLICVILNKLHQEKISVVNFVLWRLQQI